MYFEQKQAMKAISEYAGGRLDFVQGGGGNTSYKFDDRIMAIKASGYAMSDVTEENGYVTVDYSTIKERYAALENQTDIDIEKQTLAVNLASVSLLPGMEERRPSVEVGFHSFLKRAVIHTHSLYANLLCCSKEGESIAKQIFGSSDLGYIFIPFINPGYKLSMFMKQKINEYEHVHGRYPDVVFMKNHGIIASHDDASKAVKIHDTANKMIAEHFGCTAFPQPKIAADRDLFDSDTPFLKAFIKKFGADETYFDTKILYPDQLVYLGANLGKKILIDVKEGRIRYKTSLEQAQMIEAVILGVAYIISEIARAGLTLECLCDEGIHFIRNWESEKYRASLVGS